MTIWWLILIIFTLAAWGGGFVWLALQITSLKSSQKDPFSLDQAPNQAVEHFFDKEFREELRNRGRLHFEKIIGENAVYLQQDLRLTTGQISDYMKNEISTKLKTEFEKYEQSITDAKTMAMDAIKKTNDAIEEQRGLVAQEVQKQIAAEKEQMIAKFEKNMADIINHYVVESIGNQIDLNSQLEFILGELENNKKAIIEDINHGA
jgi:hypothetical protein